MTDETSDTDSDSDRPKPNNPHQKPNKLRIRACDLSIEAQSYEMDVDEMMEECAPEMREVMEYHLAGEYEIIEERDLFAEIFGGQR
ncbi:hypothetical protein DQW50_04130 [Halorubrum sp. 48-1-W]|uniref:hypothetical protein n=1 Tax=Halorubrum sp. 48-1-W TaxID=2249761 RepID=UPI000DCC34E5|nr:hypothetical protein [Halorubrum sp. 48-1-W]RAW46426.1 hypothetical protein DQW50_04130 [Halorubrum sp. 48-1-W]